MFNNKERDKMTKEKTYPFLMIEIEELTQTKHLKKSMERNMFLFRALSMKMEDLK